MYMCFQLYMFFSCTMYSTCFQLFFWCAFINLAIAEHVHVFYSCTCFLAVHIFFLCMFSSCTCFSCTCFLQLYMFSSCTCFLHLNIFSSCTCFLAVHVFYSCTCFLAVHVFQLYIFFRYTCFLLLYMFSNVFQLCMFFSCFLCVPFLWLQLNLFEHDKSVCQCLCVIK